MRICTQCEVSKPESDFDGAGQGGRLRGNCKPCAYKVLLARKARDPKKFANEHRFRVVKHKYGLAKDEFLALLERQGWRCAICDASVDVSSHVDHCHVTAAVRGVLCPPCNLGLGHFRDDADLLVRASDYLRGASSES